MDYIRVAVIGVGNMGYTHAANIFAGRLRGMRLAALCDIDQTKRQRCAVAFEGIPVFEDYRELLAAHTADTVIIATPHYSHPQIAIDAFEEGYHVLTEKPAGVCVFEVERVNRAARLSGRVYGIMFNQRTNPLFAQARDIVKSGQLGSMKRLVWIITNWYRTQYYYDSGDWRATWSGEGGGVLINQAPHNLDLWQWIFGMPASISAHCRVAQYHKIEVEDDAAIYAEYEGGATATFITSTGEFPGTNRLEISGDMGKLVLEDGVMKWWRLKASEREFCFSSKKSFDKIPFDYEEIRPEKKETGHLGILENFAGAVLRGEELLAPGYEGLKQVYLTSAAYLSSWRGGEAVKLPPDGDEFAAFLKERTENSHSKNKTDSGMLPGGEYSERWQVRW